MKSARQNVILEIIASSDIETQNQLMQALAARGVSSTQATLSRDIKELRLDEGAGAQRRYRYAPASHDEAGEHSERLKKIFKESVISCETAMNIIVIKTPAGPGERGRLRPGRHGHPRPGGLAGRRRHGLPCHAGREERRIALRGDQEAVLNRTAFSEDHGCLQSSTSRT